MSAAPFRDLFIELPRTLFEALQGIGEQAVRQATAPPAHVRPSPVSLLLRSFEDGSRLHAALAERLGWRKFTLMRSAISDEIEVRAVRWCGHRINAAIHEKSLYAADSTPQAFMLALAAMNLGVCTCMRREG